MTLSWHRVMKPGVMSLAYSPGVPLRLVCRHKIHTAKVQLSFKQRNTKLCQKCQCPQCSALQLWQMIHESAGLNTNRLPVQPVVATVVATCLMPTESHKELSYQELHTCVHSHSTVPSWYAGG
jgi:hypothetical protein